MLQHQYVFLQQLCVTAGCTAQRSVGLRCCSDLPHRNIESLVMAQQTIQFSVNIIEVRLLLAHKKWPLINFGCLIESSCIEVKCRCRAVSTARDICWVVCAHCQRDHVTLLTDQEMKRLNTLKLNRKAIESMRKIVNHRTIQVFPLDNGIFESDKYCSWCELYFQKLNGNEKKDINHLEE